MNSPALSTQSRADAATNPYVGPRSFTTSEQLFGRARETTEFIDLLLSERIVLLHSQSGAGKTSLIHAAVIPRLIEEGFDVLPTIRVSRPPLPGEESAGANRYLVSATRDLTSDMDAPALAGTMRLDECVAALAARAATPSPTLMVFDQFEELLTLDSGDREAKQEFCRQVGAILSDRSRWAIFAMREEYIGGLAPFIGMLPTRLANRFRLELLSPEAARESIRRPAEGVGVTYEERAVDRLVDDLRRVQQQTSSNTIEERLGPYIEPVHLQVVCTNLWLGLPAGTTRIGEAQVANVGTVDSALGGYYAAAVSASAAAGSCDERSLRMYIGEAFIVNGVRAQALAGQETQHGVTALGLKALDDRYVVRRDERRGGIWYELSHDRLIQPVLRDNERWKREKDPEIVKMAEEWERLGRPTRLLLLTQPERAVRAIFDLRRRERARVLNKGPAFVTPPYVKEYIKAGARFQAIVLGALLLLGVVTIGVTYGLTAYQENADLKSALDDKDRAIEEKARAFKDLQQAMDSARKVSTVLYQKSWGLEDTSASNVKASVEINRTLQRVVKQSGGAQTRSISINYYAKRSDAQRVEFALKELGFAVVTKPAFKEDIATNAVSYGPDVPASDLRIIALAIARTGASLRRLCPFVGATGRERTVEIIGSAPASALPPLTLSMIEAVDPAAGVQCDRRQVRAR